MGVVRQGRSMVIDAPLAPPPSVKPQLFLPFVPRMSKQGGPVVAAWGVGVDSTAMLVELVESGDAPDLVLFADTGNERATTYAFLPIFARWLAMHGIQVKVVRYQAKRFKHYPPYRTLGENCLTNGTLPSIAFGRKSCSQKWKISPQNSYVQNWEVAREWWAEGGRVTKLIGYDCSPADLKRYAEAEGYDDPLYTYRYPLRELGWERKDCVARIQRAGLPVPTKSACYFCTATKPAELHTYPQEHLRTIVLMEARAYPRLQTVEGLWRTSIKGHRGATPRPGRMSEYIAMQGILPEGEVERIWKLAPVHLIKWQQAFATGQHTGEMKEWLELFERASAFDEEVESVVKPGEQWPEYAADHNPAIPPTPCQVSERVIPFALPKPAAVAA